MIDRAETDSEWKTKKKFFEISRVKIAFKHVVYAMWTEIIMHRPRPSGGDFYYRPHSTRICLCEKRAPSREILLEILPSRDGRLAIK